MEIRRILKQHTFLLVLIFCAAFLASGIVSVRERTRYNMDMETYDTVEIKREEEGVFVRLGENESFSIPDYTEFFAGGLQKNLFNGINFTF